MSMETLVALALVQESMDELPCVIDAGIAENVPVGDDVMVTVTVTCFVVVPPAPVSVSV